MEIRLHSKRPYLTNILCIAVAVFFILITRYLGGGMNRPLEQDELVSLKYYTSVPYDFNALLHDGNARWSVTLLARGWVKCFLNPWNPNSHVLNSLLTSLSAFLFGFHAWSFRLPALGASMLTAAALFIYSRIRIGVLPALGLVLALMAHPYFVYYSMACRGYTITVFLVLCSIWITGKFLVRPSLWVGGGMALCHVMMFLNLGSMLFVWIVPVTLAVLAEVFRREPRAVTISENLTKLAPALWVAVGTFLSIGMYIVGALHYFFQAQGRYGLIFKGGMEFVQGLHGMVHELSPGPAWILIFLLGSAGYIAILRTERRWLVHTVFLSVVISLLYTVAAHKFLYPRTFGYAIVLATIGFVKLWVVAGRNPLAARVIRPAMAIVLLWALVVSTRGALNFESNREPTYSELAMTIYKHCHEPNALIELPWVYGEEMAAYLPVDGKWYGLRPEVIGKPVAVYFPCVSYQDQAWFRTQTRDRSVRELDYCPISKNRHLMRDYKTLTVWRVNTIAYGGFNNIPADTTEAIIVWNKKDRFFSLASYVRENLAVKRYPWIMEATNMTPELLQLFATSPEEITAARQIIADLDSRTQGALYVLVPQP